MIVFWLISPNASQCLQKINFQQRVNMADDDFQVIISTQDYEKLQTHQTQNKKLKVELDKLIKDNTELKTKNKDLARSVYVRDAYIEQLVNEVEASFGQILGLEIISSDITKSFYQDVVSHQQNGISSIEMRHALEAFTDQNKNIFYKVGDLVRKFHEQEKRIVDLESLTKRLKSEIREPSSIIKTEEKASNAAQKAEKQALLKEIQAINHTIAALYSEERELKDKNKSLKDQNVKINKDLQMLSKKKQITGEKSYVIKLMIDEYYAELEQNLGKIGGLEMSEIGTVIANEMKGILQYIQNLCKKAGGRN